MNKKLKELYEDAILEEAMNQYMEEEGARLLEENKRLNEAPTFEVPEGFDERCRKTIQREFRKKAWKSVGKSMKRVGFVAAMLLMVVSCGSVIGFFTVDAFRVEVLNMVMEEQEDHTDLTFVPEEQVAQEGQISIDATWMPEGYEESVFETVDGMTVVEYSNEVDKLIKVFVHAVSSGQSIDTEGAEWVDRGIQVNGSSAVAVKKENMVSIFWADEVQKITLSVYADGLTEEELLQFAEALVVKR